MANVAQKSPDVALYARLADESLKRILPLLPKKERNNAGGSFSLLDPKSIPYFAFRVGNSPEHKHSGRWRRSLEKPRRAHRRGDKTSRASRRPSRDWWGGSLWGDLSNRRGGFSGLPEDFDEIFVADVMVSAGDMSTTEAFKQLKKNKTFQKVWRSFHWATMYH